MPAGNEQADIAIGTLRDDGCQRLRMLQLRDGLAGAADTEGGKAKEVVMARTRAPILKMFMRFSLES